MDWQRCTGFQWDSANTDKIRGKHRVSRAECEQVFFNRPLVVQHDKAHSRVEERYYALGRTDGGRGLFVVFTTRADAVRVISARDMSRRERRVFARAQAQEDS